MDGITIGALIASVSSLLGLIGVVMKIVGPMQERAKQDGIREQLMKEMVKDIDGIGSKVNHLQTDHNRTNDKVIELESTIASEFKNINTTMAEIKTMLRDHIAFDGNK